MSATEQLSVRNVTKDFDGISALDGLTLDIPRRQMTLLIGPNGSGKTTLLNTISGVYKPDAGYIVFEGTDITGWSPNRVHDIGICRTFQIPAPFLSLSVLENVLSARKMGGGESFLFVPFRKRWDRTEHEAEERALGLLKLLGLADKWELPASSLSGGQLKLLEMARALMGGGKLVLLDEPVAGVLPTLAEQIMTNLCRLRDELHATFLLVEHRLDLALRFVDFVYAMNFGKVIAGGKPNEITKDRRVIEAYLGG